jgi:hypothetical protein
VNSVSPTGGVETNPFSPSSRFLHSSVVASYRQTQRLSYTFSGSFFLNRYSYGGAIGTTGGIFSASASYVLTARTTIGGTYSHDNFYAQHNAGDTNIDGGFGTLTHIFGRDWRASISAGITHAHTSGIITLPVSVIIPGQGSVIIGYVTGPYDRKTNVPTVQGTISHKIGNYFVSGSAGRGVTPGNGTYLTSSHTYFGGTVSRKLDRSSTIAASFSYSRLSSIANQVMSGYSQTYFTTEYSRMILSHVSVFVSYSNMRYGSLGSFSANTNNRILFGVNVSTKSIPLTLF